MNIGILAYGSLIGDPGPEIEPLITERIQTVTPFPVEYARESKKRGYSYTVVPHPTGRPVKAKILVLSEEVSLKEAKDLLYRREKGAVGSGEEYEYKSLKNAVVVQDTPGFHGIAHVLYTDFNPAGKKPNPDPNEMATAAIKSVRIARCGNDGISYLINLISNGVITELTDSYRQEILKQTNVTTLSKALQLAKMGAS